MQFEMPGPRQAHGIKHLTPQGASLYHVGAIRVPKGTHRKRQAGTAVCHHLQAPFPAIDCAGQVDEHARPLLVRRRRSPMPQKLSGQNRLRSNQHVAGDDRLRQLNVLLVEELRANTRQDVGLDKRLQYLQHRTLASRCPRLPTHQSRPRDLVREHA
eukprot:6286-Prymnesium_polylepis.2